MGLIHRVDPSEPRFAEPRLSELDGLRGIACLGILVYHLKPPIVPFGWAAVDLFFVLSGFLITRILIQHPPSGQLLTSFYARRGLRIWPVYYLTILLIALAGPILPVKPVAEGLPYLLTYTQNLTRYWSDKAPLFSPYLAHFWTLANEEQFYLVWPLLIVVFGRRSVIPAALALAATSVFMRIRGFDSWLLLARADGFAMGGLLAAILSDNERVACYRDRYRNGFRLVTVISALLLIFAITQGYLPKFGRPPKGAGFSVLWINTAFLGLVGMLVVQSGQPGVAWLRRPRLVRIGVISYGLYVYHFVFLMLGGDIVRSLGGRGRPFWVDLISMGLTFSAAHLSWEYLEKPLLRFKKRFSYDSHSTSNLTRPIREHAQANRS